jgi:RNA polymerase sigma-70 factor, ECF subfamily
VDAPEGDRGGGFPDAFDRYAPAILGYARRRLDSREAGWDVVSDTFTSAWRHWDRRPGPDELLPWLYAIAGNSVRDHRRSAERRRRLLARLAAVRRNSHAADPAEGVVLGGSIGDALSRLPEADREVLRLVAWEGQTDARALGLVLGVSPAAARSRVHRARRRLRALLDDSGLDDPGLDDPGDPAPGAAGRLGGSPIRQHAKEV